MGGRRGFPCLSWVHRMVSSWVLVKIMWVTQWGKAMAPSNGDRGFAVRNTKVGTRLGAFVTLQEKIESEKGEGNGCCRFVPLHLFSENNLFSLVKIVLCAELERGCETKSLTSGDENHDGFVGSHRIRLGSSLGGGPREERGTDVGR